MNDAEAMRFAKGVRDFLPNLQGFFDGRCTSLQPICKSLALQKLHYEKGHAALSANVV
jgi:hypothetical protein